MFMNKLKTYITTYLFSFIGYCISIFPPFLYIKFHNAEEGLFSNLYFVIFLTAAFAIYPNSLVIVCYIVEYIAKKFFNYEFQLRIKNNKIDFIFKLGIFLGLLPYVLTLSGIIFYAGLLLLIGPKLLSNTIIKIILISGMSYCCYIIAKYIFKKDTI